MTKAILLLVSDPLVRTVLTETLEHKGYLVLIAGDLGQAVDRLREVTPGLLIIRGHVQNMPGHDAAVYIRKKCPQMKVLILGGLLDDIRLKNREVLQGFDIFPKPYPAAELLDKIEEVLKRPRG